jgi:16S rRNA (cytosine1402-N4)-methyltransferase
MGQDTRGETTAADFLNETSEKVLEGVLRNYADEPRARRLASEITRRREKQPFSSSDDLVRAIRAALGPRSGPSDFARIFQAFRIAVNDEAESLVRALPKLRDILKPSGVMVVISYHSGEDRVVKNAFRDWEKGCVCPPRQPVCTCGRQPLGQVLTRKAVTASPAEISSNPRSRSARLRAWRKNG